MTLKTPPPRHRPPSIKGDRIHVKSLNEWPIRLCVYASVKSSSVNKPTLSLFLQWILLYITWLNGKEKVVRTTVAMGSWEKGSPFSSANTN